MDILGTQIDFVVLRRQWESIQSSEHFTEWCEINPMLMKYIIKLLMTMLKISVSQYIESRRHAEPTTPISQIRSDFYKVNVYKLIYFLL